MLTPQKLCGPRKVSTFYQNQRSMKKSVGAKTGDTHVERKGVDCDTCKEGLVRSSISPTHHTSPAHPPSISSPLRRPFRSLVYSSHIPLPSFPALPPSTTPPSILPSLLHPQPHHGTYLLFFPSMLPLLLCSDLRYNISHRSREMTGISLSIADTSARLGNRQALLPRLLRCLEAVPCCTASDTSHRLPRDAEQRTSCLSLQCFPMVRLSVSASCVSPHHKPSKQASSQQAFHWTCRCSDLPEPKHICRSSGPCTWPRTPSLEPCNLAILQRQRHPRQIDDKFRRSRRIGIWWHKPTAARRIIWPRLHLRGITARRCLIHIQRLSQCHALQPKKMLGKYKVARKCKLCFREYPGTKAYLARGLCVMPRSGFSSGVAAASVARLNQSLSVGQH